MECVNWKNWHVTWKRRKKLSWLDLDSGYMVNRYSLYVRIYGGKGGGGSHIGVPQSMNSRYELQINYYVLE